MENENKNKNSGTQAVDVLPSQIWKVAVRALFVLFTVTMFIGFVGELSTAFIFLAMLVFAIAGAGMMIASVCMFVDAFKYLRNELR